MQISINARVEEISKASIAIDQALRKSRVSDEDRMRVLFTMEEVLVLIIENTTPNNRVNISLYRHLHGQSLNISCKGHQIDLGAMVNAEGLDLSDSLMAPEAEDHIREIFLQSQSEYISASYKRGINRVTMRVTRSNKVALINACLGVLLGLLVGLIVRLACPADIASMLTEYIFVPMYDLFLTAIKMLMAPLVFFSLVSSLIGLSDLRSLERLGGKVFGLYLVTAIAAITITTTMMSLLSPGEFGSMVNVFDSSSEADSEFSPLNMILHIVPDSFVAPFVNTDMLQVLFLAICFGVTASLMGKNSLPICTFVECMNDLFNKLMEIVSKAIPFAVFGSMANMIISMDLKSNLMVLSLAGTILLCILLMVGFYSLLLIFNGLNPYHVFRSHLDAVVTAASSFSANAAMPVAMRCCRDDGISPRIYSFSIPLGSTINMDGTSIFHVSCALFLANLCGVEMGVGTMLTLVFTVMLMGLATPSAPGAGIACQTMLLSMIGVPTDSMVLILVLESLIEPVIIAMETVCDGVVTTIVAKSEGELHVPNAETQNQKK